MDKADNLKIATNKLFELCNTELLIYPPHVGKTDLDKRVFLAATLNAFEIVSAE